MDNKNQNVIVEEACEIISNNLGDITAGYYREFYQGKTPEIITSSLAEILEELVGSQNAEKQVKKIKSLIKNK